MQADTYNVPLESLSGLAILAIVVGLLASFWLANAWVLLLSARIFADVDIGWRKSLLAVLAGAVVQGCAGSVLMPLALADGAGVNALESLAATIVSWLVWAGAVSSVTGLDPKGTILTSLGMVGVTAAFGFAIEAGFRVAFA